MASKILERLRRLVARLPETHEVESWGVPTFRVKNKLFGMYSDADNHTGDSRPGLWLKTTSENQQYMIQFAPKRFYFPAYVGKSGWVGIYMDVCDWDELVDLLRDAYLMTAPKRVAALLVAPEQAPPAKTKVAATKTARKAKPAAKQKTAARRATASKTKKPRR